MALNSGAINMDKSEEERMKSQGQLLRTCLPEIGLGTNKKQISLNHPK